MKFYRMEKLFWGHPSRKNENAVTLYFRITLNGQRAELGSTGIQIDKRHWNTDAQRITARTPEANQQNQTLEVLRTRVQAIYNDLLLKGKAFTANHIKQIFKQEGKSYSYLHLFDLYLNGIEKDPSISKGTEETYKVVRAKFATWLRLKGQPDLLAERLTLGVLEQYRSYMRIDEGRLPATIRKHTSTVKQVLTWAFLNDYISRDPLHGYRVPREKAKPPVFLTPAELHQLLTFDFGTERVLAEVRDYFVISCFTGLAYADLKSLRSEHLSYKEVVTENETLPVGLIWLEKDRIKTDVTARQPLHPVVQYILNARYGGQPEKLHIRPNQKTNLYLKIIALRVGFTKTLTTHIGRKTFTNLCLNGGLYSDRFADVAPEVRNFYNTCFSTEATITMMGRTSAKGLEVYAQPDERRIMLEMKHRPEPMPLAG